LPEPFSKLCASAKSRSLIYQSETFFHYRAEPFVGFLLGAEAEETGKWHFKPKRYLVQLKIGFVGKRQSEIARLESASVLANCFPCYGSRVSEKLSAFAKKFLSLDTVDCL
jgi:hypothetical protein